MVVNNYDPDLAERLKAQWRAHLADLVDITTGTSSRTDSGGLVARARSLDGGEFGEDVFADGARAYGASPLRELCDELGLPIQSALVRLAKAAAAPIVEPEVLALPSLPSPLFSGYPIAVVARTPFGTATLLHAMPMLQHVVDLEPWARWLGVTRLHHVIAHPDAVETLLVRLNNTGRFEQASFEDAMALPLPDPAPLARTLTALDLVSRDDVADATTAQEVMNKVSASLRPHEASETAWSAIVHNMPVLDITEHLPSNTADAIPLAVLRRFDAAAIALTGRALTLAVPRHLTIAERSEIESCTAVGMLRVFYVLASRRDIREALNHAQARDISPTALADKIDIEGDSEEFSGEHIDIESLSVRGAAVARVTDADSEKDAVVQLVQAILLHGIQNKASDIHISGHRDRMWVRYRIDGRFSDYPHHFPPAMARSVIARLKVLAKLDTQYMPVPQDGKIALAVNDTHYELRINTSNTAVGEKAVLRIQEKDKGIPSLDSLGIGGYERSVITGVIDSDHGLLVLTGPTGAGKTTTLYAAIGQIDRKSWNVITLEDPVEMEIPNTEQHAIGKGFTWELGVEAALRQDPDYLMVAETRSRETAASVIRAAITGHVVMTTLHTNSAAAAPARLIDLGVAPYLLADALSAVCAQRLLRRLCPYCASPTQPPTLKELRDMKIDPHWIPPGAKFYEPKGCAQCRGTGYRGRVGVMEAYINDSNIRDIIKRHNASPEMIRAAMIAAGGKTLLQHAVERVAEGITSLTEAVSIASVEDHV